VVAMSHLGPSGENSTVGSGAPPGDDQSLHGFLHLRLTGTPGAAAARNNPRPKKHVEQASARATSRAKPTVTQRMTLVSNTVPAASVSTAPTASTTSAAPPDTGPSPLRAPPGGSGPSPLKAP